jgi:hypothetical protein
MAKALEPAVVAAERPAAAHHSRPAGCGGGRQVRRGPRGARHRWAGGTPAPRLRLSEFARARRGAAAACRRS